MNQFFVYFVAACRPLKHAINTCIDNFIVLLLGNRSSTRAYPVLYSHLNDKSNSEMRGFFLCRNNAGTWENR